MAYESGRVKLYNEMLIRIALALQVSADEILGLEKPSSEGNRAASLRIAKRIRQIENLPANDQRVLVRDIDMFLKASVKENRSKKPLPN